MLVLGIAGGLERVHEPSLGTVGHHDSAAVLLKDGEIVAAIEEERLNRIKHTSCFPLQALRRCLELGGIGLNDVDVIAVYFRESYLDFSRRRLLIDRLRAAEHISVRARMSDLLEREFGCQVSGRIRFYSHHESHAASAFYCSGQGHSLIAVIDGQGEGVSTSVYMGSSDGLTLLDTQVGSIGFMYDIAISVIGYNPFDEYKVMGLAPYGDPAVFRGVFEECITLGRGGSYVIDLVRMAALLQELIPSRDSHQDIRVVDKDLAAATQEATERLVNHVLDYWRDATGIRDVCLAGGVAQNCTMNGRLLRSGGFRDVFVQPVAYDAGAALGAAILAYREATGSREVVGPGSLKALYLGTPLQPAVEEEAASRWEAWITAEHLHDPAEAAARLLANGEVIGWMQGRSEFGPRALGNRSILADPRPATNKDRINAMIKKREAFRPFAPAVLLKEASGYFELGGASRQMPFMIFVMPVRPEHREHLGAVTHIDGSARLQTVSQDDNPRFASLLESFGRITGTPLLLNTSFNNSHEPIVDAVDDAITCFITTGLDALVVGNTLFRKRDQGREAILQLDLTIPAYCEVTKSYRKSDRPHEGRVATHEIRHVKLSRYSTVVSRKMYRVLKLADGQRSVATLSALAGDHSSQESVSAELWELWERRLVELRPGAGVSRVRGGG